MHTLAVQCRKLGWTEEAMELASKMLDPQKRILGEEHPDTLTSIRVLAVHYVNLGRDEEAVQLASKTVDTRKRILGQEHPDNIPIPSCLCPTSRYTTEISATEKRRCSSLAEPLASKKDWVKSIPIPSILFAVSSTSRKIP